MNKHDFAKNQTKKRKKYGLKECESLLIDRNCSNSDVLDFKNNNNQKREIIDYVINHHIEIKPEVLISEFDINYRFGIKVSINYIVNDNLIIS